MMNPMMNLMVFSLLVGVDDDDDEVAERNDGLDQHDNRRDRIATDMWAQYVNEHLCRRIPLQNI